MTTSAKKIAKRATKRRRVAVVTGSRAEYGLLLSTIGAISRHKKLELQLVVTGMHLVRKLGHTVDEIVSDGWKIAARVAMQKASDDSLDQAEGLARGVAGIAEFLHREKTDVVLVLGDRIEAMAGALAGLTTGKIVGHIHGGDVAPGDFDDSLRHAISKLAHVHFPATRDAGRRIIRMGEDKSRVHVVGPPAQDRIIELLARHKGKRNRTGWAMVVHHPCGRSADVEQRVMSNVISAVQSAGLNLIIIHPNSDRGHSGIITAIETAAKQSRGQTIEVHKSVDRDQYLDWLINVDVLVGNSSSGVLEAPLVGTPAVNIGSRQQGRERLGRGVIDCGENESSIYRAITRGLKLRRSEKSMRKNASTRTVGQQIAQLLATIPVDEAFRRKLIAY